MGARSLYCSARTKQTCRAGNTGGPLRTQFGHRQTTHLVQFEAAAVHFPMHASGNSVFSCAALYVKDADSLRGKAVNFPSTSYRHSRLDINIDSDLATAELHAITW